MARGRKALLIIGGAHLVRGISNNNVTARIESQHPRSMLIIIPHDGFREQHETLEPRLKSWKAGSLALLKGTWLGSLHPRQRWPQMKDAKLRDSKVDPKLEDVADGWLWVGERDQLTEALPFPGIYRDEYWNELRLFVDLSAAI